LENACNKSRVVTNGYRRCGIVELENWFFRREASRKKANGCPPDAEHCAHGHQLGEGFEATVSFRAEGRFF